MPTFSERFPQRKVSRPPAPRVVAPAALDAAPAAPVLIPTSVTPDVDPTVDKRFLTIEQEVMAEEIGRYDRIKFDLLNEPQEVVINNGEPMTCSYRGLLFDVWPGRNVLPRCCARHFYEQDAYRQRYQQIANLGRATREVRNLAEKEDFVWDVQRLSNMEVRSSDFAHKRTF